MPRSGATTVLIVHDQALQRLGLRMLLAAQPGLAVVGDTVEGAEAVRLSARLRPDVVLLDSAAAGPDGIGTIRRLSRPDTLPRPLGVVPPAEHRPRVLVLSQGRPDTYTYAALRAGAAGLLSKDATPDELTAALRTVAAGDAVASPGLTRALIDAVRRERPSVTPPPEHRLAVLTERERDVLTAVASGASNAEIAGLLCIAPTTVKSHVSSILTKIGARARVQAVVFAYESGLVRPHAPATAA
ncbi:response regulator transcription factor [Streptomyces sp. ALI-76-A]|uniref:LuxR C-terminal-related transcriptional regulator n=1 Tax=Streptomyces sp. ALI-76-A TaxID=3025736 RepID=UPI00256EC876|nr:response regulator transcription factor [Streptomyces sp. ALI-76-A]MDL5204685.1 response regulator transcription factor [Streptomyces sp. ALI-76-A]